jgi:putative FmdB family regulatory protein
MLDLVPRYDFRCRACGDTFEVTRPMARAAEAASCPAGHDDTVRLLSTVAVTGRGGARTTTATTATTAATPAPRGASGGGCCGGGCCG